jgi:hypothetical protein
LRKPREWAKENQQEKIEIKKIFKNYRIFFFKRRIKNSKN